MALPRIIASLIGLITLSACFYSEVSLIPAATQITLPYDEVVLCLAKDCRAVTPDAGGVYEITPPENEPDERPLHVRFELLVPDDANPVYLAEAEMRDGEEVSYHYLVAHLRLPETSDVRTYEFAMPACADAPRAALDQFKLVKVDTYSCKVTDLDAFKQYVIEAHGEDFGTAAFWTED